MSSSINRSITAAELGIGQRPNLPVDKRADWKNWTVAPYNRWSFQRVQQFTRTLRVPRAEQVSLLNERLRDFSSLTFTDTEGKDCTIEKMLDRTWTDGFLVMHKGVILTESYFNGMNASTLHLMMSCSKSLTSTVVGIYVEKGLLEMNSPIENYLPELKDTGIAGATLQQLLDMRVGVKFSEDYQDLNADWRQCEVATGWRQPENDYTGPLDMLSYAQSLKEKEKQHGGTFHYQSILTDVIGCALERVTGRQFADLFAEHIWHPIGAEQDLVSIIDNAGHAVFEGGFNVCLRDFARFALLICNEGRYKGQQLVPKNWINQCRFPSAGLVNAFSESEYAEVIGGGAYHNQWWVKDPEKGVVMALGVHGQALYIDPGKELVVAKMSSQPEMVDVSMVMDQLEAFDAISNSLT